MPDRAGPPTPRNAPYRGDDVLALDDAFTDWYHGGGIEIARGYAQTEAAFRAGVNYARNNPQKTIDTVSAKDEYNGTNAYPDEN